MGRVAKCWPAVMLFFLLEKACFIHTKHRGVHLFPALRADIKQQQ